MFCRYFLVSRVKGKQPTVYFWFVFFSSFLLLLSLPTRYYLSTPLLWEVLKPEAKSNQTYPKRAQCTFSAFSSYFHRLLRCLMKESKKRLRVCLDHWGHIFWAPVLLWVCVCVCVSVSVHVLATFPCPQSHMTNKVKTPQLAKISRLTSATKITKTKKYVVNIFTNCQNEKLTTNNLCLPGGEFWICF